MVAASCQKAHSLAALSPHPLERYGLTIRVRDGSRLPLPCAPPLFPSGSSRLETAPSCLPVAGLWACGGVRLSKIRLYVCLRMRLSKKGEEGVARRCRCSLEERHVSYPEGALRRARQERCGLSLQVAQQGCCTGSDLPSPRWEATAAASTWVPCFFVCPPEDGRIWSAPAPRQRHRDSLRSARLPSLDCD